MMSPIPRRLLIHSAVLRQMDSDRWQNETEKQSVALTNVRVEPSSKIVIGKDNVERQLSAVLFFDCRSSQPKNTVFTEGRRITFSKNDYRIVSIEPLYDDGRLHHYEVGLC